MIAIDFTETCSTYENFEIWEVDSIESFFKGNQILETIFTDFYKISVEDLFENRIQVQETDYQIILKLLKEVSDKTFFVFTLHDKNHFELIGLQKMKVMNFGIDIEKIKHNHIYIMIMDKQSSRSLNFG
ncbi:hypothetical protein EP331_01355 [bacterium]|nr:MAG: hypothetical protein EP331_01355 [bacterium]